MITIVASLTATCIGYLVGRLYRPAPRSPDGYIVCSNVPSGVDVDVDCPSGCEWIGPWRPIGYTPGTDPDGLGRTHYARPYCFTEPR